MHTALIMHSHSTALLVSPDWPLCTGQYQIRGELKLVQFDLAEL